MRYSTQAEFDALDLHSRRICRVPFSDVDPSFLFKFRDVFSVITRDMVQHGLPFSTPSDADIRATFFRFFNNTPHGKIILEFLNRVSTILKDMLGFDIDMEFALTQSQGQFCLNLLQLRPFGISGKEIITLSKVPEADIIAKTSDCFGHGKCFMETILILTKDAATDTGRSQACVSNVDVGHAGKYLLIGPNVIDQMGRGGVYVTLSNPGAVLSYTADASMANEGTHVFCNAAVLPIIPTSERAISPKVDEILRTGNVTKLAEGVFLVKGVRVAVELDDMSGNGQAYFQRGDVHSE